jgi:hypothetical protein
MDDDLESKETYKFNAELKWPNGSRLEVPCKLFLPIRLRDSLRLVLLLDDPSYRALYGTGPFELVGTIGNGSGQVKIVANEVWIGSGKQRIWGPGLSEGYLVGHPQSLRVIKGRPETPSTKLHGTFNLTHSLLLSPFDSPRLHADGTIEWSRSKRKTFHLSPDILLTFDHEHHYDIRRDPREILMWPELVAKVTANVPPAAGSLEHYLPMIDDLLLLVSLVEGKMCACLQSAWTCNGELVHLYRLDKVIPGEAPKLPVGEFLIAPEDFLSFLAASYKTLRENPQRHLIRSALEGMVMFNEDTIGAEFVRLFTALETSILAFRRENGLEYVLAKSGQRKELRRYLNGVLEEHPLLKEDSDRLHMLSDNLSGLARVSLKTALEKCASAFEIELADCWPIFETPSSGGISLSKIRNMLVHGSDFSEPAWDCIADAGISLRVIAQRFLLRILGWDHQQSIARLSPSRWSDWRVAQARLTRILA